MVLAVDPSTTQTTSCERHPELRSALTITGRASRGYLVVEVCQKKVEHEQLKHIEKRLTCIASCLRVRVIDARYDQLKP